MNQYNLYVDDIKYLAHWANATARRKIIKLANN